MTAALLGSKETTSGGQICGNMTSGGAESIPLAVKTSRDYMKAKKGITKPEMIIAESAHSAYDKAAQYFNIKIRRVPVTKEMIADVKGIKRCINKNTILLCDTRTLTLLKMYVTSAPVNACAISPLLGHVSSHTTA